jgi:hypothetical protein
MRVEEDAFYAPPGAILEQGDAFLEIPFPVSKFPLQFFRPSLKQKGMASLYSADDPAPVDAKPGDSLKGTFEFKTVMLISHGCEIEQVERERGAVERRAWLAALLARLGECGKNMQKRTRENRQPNKFYLQASQYDAIEWYLDLRKITPVQCRYFYNAKKLFSLTPIAGAALWSSLGIFFSGLALYQGPIMCPGCHEEIDASKFVVKSNDDPEVD